jgi:hypothetical protein
MSDHDRLPSFLQLEKWAGMMSDEADRRHHVAIGLQELPTGNPERRRAAIADQRRLSHEYAMLADFLEWCANRAARLDELNQRPAPKRPAPPKQPTTAMGVRDD